MKNYAFFCFLTALISANAQTTGEAAASSAQATSEWQNWTFAASALVTAAAAVLVVSIDQGHSPTSH